MTRPASLLARSLALALLLSLSLASLAMAENAAPELIAPQPAAQSPSPPALPLTLLPGREHDELWLISTRRGGGGCECGHLPVQRASGCGHWQWSTMAEFLSAEPSMLTIFFVHGNRVSPALAVDYGVSAYRALLQQAPPTAPVRFVIWSWPSEKVKGQIRDIRAKAARTNADGYYLACVVNQLDPTTPVGLWGYSFGARITTGALHLLGGGHMGGYTLSATPLAKRPPIRVVLMAAALHNYWLLPGRYHGQALDPVEAMLLINNSCDRALKHYHLVTRCGSPDALGYTGFAGPYRLGIAAEKVSQMDACCIVGEEHDLRRYLASPRLMGAAWTTLAPSMTLAP